MADPAAAAPPTETLTLRATLKGHAGWVTALATSAQIPNMLVSASRDKTIMVWDIVKNEVTYAVPRRSLKGHNHFVSDIVISSDGHYVLSSSWDKTLRLWNVDTGVTSHRFVGHTGDVLSVSLSPDNRQVISGSRDKSIKLWNIIGQCKFTFTNEGHHDWVSCVRFSPDISTSTVVSCSWDKLVKVWDMSDFKIKSTHDKHTGYVNTVTISPDGSLCASGGKDGVTMLWDLNESRHLYSLEDGDIVNALVFSPNRYWLCAATGSNIKVWDLEKKKIVVKLIPEFEFVGKNSQPPQCISLAWSADGQTLFAGYTDNHIRAWQISIPAF